MPLKTLELYNWAYDVGFQAFWKVAPFTDYINAPANMPDTTDCPPTPKPPVSATEPHKPESRTDPGASGDPNDMSTTGYDPEGFTTGAEPLLFRINFENVPTATAPAQEVVITDQLDANVDWSTFELQTLGFNNVVVNVPPGLQTFTTQVNVSSDPNPVNVTVSLNPSTGVVTWTMMSVDSVTGLLPEEPACRFPAA